MYDKNYGFSENTWYNVRITLMGSSYLMEIQKNKNGGWEKLIIIEEAEDSKIEKAKGKFGFTIIGPYTTYIAYVKIEIGIENGGDPNSSDDDPKGTDDGGDKRRLPDIISYT